MGVDAMLRELNPRYDMSHYGPRDSFLSGFKNLGWFVCNQVKSVVRGGLVGVTLGAPVGVIASFVTDKSLDESVASYAAMGGITLLAIDYTQQAFRFTNHHFKHYLKMPLKGRIAVYSISGVLSAAMMASEGLYKKDLAAVNTAFTQKADVNQDGVIDSNELNSVNQALTTYYSSTNTPFTFKRLS